MWSGCTIKSKDKAAAAYPSIVREKATRSIELDAKIYYMQIDGLGIPDETGLTTEYYDTVQALMDRYCEMLEQESDWVTLVEQEMFKTQVSCKALVVGVKADFMVRADLSLAIGSNLEYEVGKRYDFWFKIGLFKPTGGSSSMDLIDERFAFQFYVMGRLGLRAGVKATFFVGLGTGDLASVGIYAELGPYVKLYGFFIYEYTKYRPANTNSWINEERMMGALYMEFKTPGFGIFGIIGIVIILMIGELFVCLGISLINTIFSILLP